MWDEKTIELVVICFIIAFGFWMTCRCSYKSSNRPCDIDTRNKD